MLFVDPTRGVQRNDDVKERLAAGNTYPHWAHDGFLSFGPGEPLQQVPEDIEARQAVHGYTAGGAADGAAAHGRRGQGAHLLHGRRLAPAADGRPAPPRSTTT